MWPNPEFPADLVTFPEEILMENLIFCAVLNAPRTLSCYVIDTLKSWISWKFENEISQFIEKLHFYISDKLDSSLLLSVYFTFCFIAGLNLNAVFLKIISYKATF